MGEAFGELKQYQPALDAFQKAARSIRSILKARYNIGVTYDRLGQFKYAEFIYRILIRDFPELRAGLRQSGRVAFKIRTRA